ncbi:MAG TPA: hypothetical protein VFU89_02700 [Rhabdochlamydiaceae bacterium]|nr:hypothetical protein [Rhabdochlamydiaceae bacterium]
MVQDVISIYTKETKACVNEGYPLDLINTLLKHSISIWRLPVLPTIGYHGIYYRECIGLKHMVNPMTGEPTSLMRFKQPTDREFGLIMRIKCHALIKFKELGPMIPSDLHPDLYKHHMWPVKFHSEQNVFETGISSLDSEPSSGRILFFTIYQWNTPATVSTNHWSADKNAFMNYAYKLKGIDKRITCEKNLSECMEEMLVGDGLFQIYSPPDQNPPPPIPPKV